MSSAQTRLGILDAAAKLIHEQGYANTGLAAILAEAGVPKGSFYHHFESKEHLALELVDHFAEQVSNVVGPAVRDTSLSPLGRLKAMFLSYRRAAAEQDYRMGCPLGKLVQELAEINEPLRLKLKERFARMNGRIEALLHQAQEQGDLRQDADIKTLAQVILDGWQGALLRMKLERGPEPLDAFLQVTFGQLLR